MVWMDRWGLERNIASCACACDLFQTETRHNLMITLVYSLMVDQIELETKLNRMDFNMMIWSGLKFVSGKNIVVCDGSRTVGEKAADRMVLGGVRVGGHERKAKKQLDWECMHACRCSSVPMFPSLYRSAWA